MDNSAGPCFDAVGIGIGPSNLSLAALIHPLDELNTRFFERAKEFYWHPGMMLPEATIQVSFLKDLVTLVDPANPYSFLSFLARTRRLYRFLNANFGKVTRQEFNQYFRWVSASLTNLEFGAEVKNVSFDAAHTNRFVIDLGERTVHANNVVLGTGLTPRVPECARAHLGRTVFHACNFLTNSVNITGGRIAVVGGGQSGAEVFFHWLSNGARPAEIHWLSRRPNFLPLDDSPFVNELFTPSYSEYFFKLHPAEKSRLVKEQQLASDGIAKDLLEKIYRRLYELEFLDSAGKFYYLRPGQELTQISPAGGAWLLEMVDSERGQTESLVADVVVLCTGYDYNLPACMEPLASRTNWTEEGFSLRRDFSINWNGPESRRIYVQNAARHARGVADPNLSLMAWRSALIINSLAGRCVYDVEEANSVFDWIDNSVTGAENNAK